MTLTVNQMILLLEIYRGTLDRAVVGGTYRDDLNRLVGLGFIDPDHGATTTRGDLCLQAMKDVTVAFTQR